MGEVLSFHEGSAYLGTGAASGLIVFVQNAQATLQVGRYSYRSPGAATRTYIETGRSWRLTIERFRSDNRLAVLLNNASGGSLWCHLKASADGFTGGVYLWTGEIQSYSHNEREGGVWGENLMAEGQTWSAY